MLTRINLIGGGAPSIVLTQLTRLTDLRRVLFRDMLDVKGKCNWGICRSEFHTLAGGNGYLVLYMGLRGCTSQGFKGTSGMLVLGGVVLRG